MKTIFEKISGSANAGRVTIVKKIDRRLGVIIGDELPVFVAARKFVIKSGGKRIRPLLHYYFCQLLGYKADEWIGVGAIGELIHSASLLHDDVIDLSQSRRGVPAFHVTQGNKRTILTGDFLLACGLDHLQSLPHGFELLGIFTRVIRNLSIGEVLQMEYETNFDTDSDIYNRIILGKTASLFGAMTEAAAVITDSDLVQRNRLRDFGQRMGRLFQIRDDYLDYFATEQSLGKAPFSDFERGLVTYPLIQLRQSLKSKDKRRLFQLWKNRQSVEVKQELSQLFTNTKLRRKLAIEIEEEIHALMNYVRAFPVSSTRDQILATLSSLLVPVTQD